MAINPIVTRPMQIPDNPKPVPIDFSFLANLGSSLGAMRERDEVGRIMQGAVGPDGNLDINKAATALAVSGRDPETYLKTAIAQASERRAEAAQRALEAHYRALEKSAETAANRPQYFHEPPTLLKPGLIIEAPRVPGAPPKVYPYTSPGATPDEPPPAPGSGGGFSGGATGAPVGGANPGPVPGPASALPPQPDQAPPYRVAGAMQPPPSAPPLATPVAEPAPAAATPAPVRNETFLKRYPANAQAVIKGIAEYELDPDKYGKDKEDLVTAAKLYRPDYKSSEFEKRKQVMPAEVAARVGLTKAFLDKLDDRTTEDGRFIPGIKSRVARGELTGSFAGRLAGYFGQGNPGELRAAIDEGSEALLRGLTGAGMNMSEAGNYARRYQFTPIDTTDTMNKKLAQLENALRYIATEEGKGRGGDDLLKGFTGKFGEGVAVKPVANDTEANTLIGQARAAIQRDPRARDEVIRRMRERGIKTPELYLGQ